MLVFRLAKKLKCEINRAKVIRAMKAIKEDKIPNRIHSEFTIAITVWSRFLIVTRSAISKSQQLEINLLKIVLDRLFNLLVLNCAVSFSFPFDCF